MTRKELIEFLGNRNAVAAEWVRATDGSPSEQWPRWPVRNQRWLLRILVDSVGIPSEYEYTAAVRRGFLDRCNAIAGRAGSSVDDELHEEGERAFAASIARSIPWTVVECAIGEVINRYPPELK